MISNGTENFFDISPKIVNQRWYSPQQKFFIISSSNRKDNFSLVFKRIVQESISDIKKVREELREKYPDVYARLPQ